MLIESLFQHADKLAQVAFRREQAKQSAIDSKLAIEHQKEHNAIQAASMRIEAEEIKKARDLEIEMAIVRNQAQALAIAEVRDTKPLVALQKVKEERVEIGKKVREELEAVRIQKELDEREEELVKADRIRQLRALNEVHKKHIVVFDPTQTAGLGLLDEMSYMEMKERLKNERIREEEIEKQRREDILESKQKWQSEIDRRSQSVMHAREVKAEANRAARIKEKEARQKKLEDEERARKEAAIVMERQLKEKRERQAAEQAALRAEQEQIKRQQQYLGAAMGQLEETRERQLELARQRQARMLSEREAEEARLLQETMVKERSNKVVLVKVEKKARVEEVVARE